MEVSEQKKLCCPACNRTSQWRIDMKFIDKIEWLKCSCGVVYQDKIVEENSNSEDYEKISKTKNYYEECLNHLPNVYMTFFEEYTYGRKLLNVSRMDKKFSEISAKRGWLVWEFGEDIGSEGVKYVGESFETGDIPKEMTFDLVYSYHEIEKSEDFRWYLSKVYKHLDHKGMLFLATPDSSFMETDGFSHFNHWFKENKMVFSRSAMVKELERAGFNVILCKRNESSRFFKNNDMHIIAQKGE